MKLTFSQYLRFLVAVPSLCLILLAAMPSVAGAQAGLEPRREFRAVWVATVANIDWPSRRDLTTAQQQAELVAIFDKAAALNLNAVILQVRPMADAFYDSPLEPWSEFLTGQTGRAPSPFWDPLAFAIEEAHKRGMALHAWFNPFRARHPSSRSQLPRNHVSRSKPEIVREYGTNLWMDPTDERTKRHTLNVILDVVRRYNVDGIHIDDYFFPYRYYHPERADFPDDANWERYRRGGGQLSRDDWRRYHVNNFVRRLYEEVKREDRRVKVGISPFGIWRPDNPPGIRGMDPFNELYADSRFWLHQGWLDYLAPQLYWPIDQTAQSYPRLLEWWVGENRRNRHIWPGNFTSQVGGQRNWEPQEIIDQIRVTRAQRGASGNMHFSMIAFMQNRRGINELLKAGPYAEPALIPPSPWLCDHPPTRPRVNLHQDTRTGEYVVSWESPLQDDVRVWAFYFRRDNEWTMRVIPAHNTRRHRIRMRGDAGITNIAVSAVDRLGNESQRFSTSMPRR